MAKYNFSGGKSKGKTLSDVAKMHGMTSEELRPQYNKGTDHELEHTNNVIIAKRIALDHLVEFPDYYDRLDKIEKMKKGSVVERPTTFNDIVLYHEKKGNWLFAKGNFYAWLYDQDGAGKKVETGEYDFIMFPQMGKGSPFSDKYVPPLLMVWQKSYQKNYKGSEHLLGIVKGFYDEDKNQLIIGMMTSNPKFRRQGINAHIIKQLRTEFGVSQDNVIFDAPTKEGKLFESSKKYHLGGDMSKHLAPNGKPSNLTHEQWHLVRTPAFKEWFGDWENDPKNSSKVVDENGEPLVCYHGSSKIFNEFEPKFLNAYSPKPETHFINYRDYAEGFGNNIYECFLDIKTPEYIYKNGEKKPYSEESDGTIILNFLDSKYKELQKANRYAVFSSYQIKLADGTNTTFDSNNPDIRFEKGGEIDETAQMYIDIISMNPSLEKYQKYKDILKNQYNIDFDSIYKDNEYIENANLQDIKDQSDFLDFDNWITYAKKISKMRGFVRMDDYMMAFKFDVTDDVWKRISDLLDFRIQKIEYIETTGSGDIARVMGNTLYYTEHADLYYLLHEIAHIYDFQNNVNGIIHNPAYSPTNYGTMNGGETFAENFAIYFINPTALKNWNEDVYNEMENTINDKYQYELSTLVTEYLGGKFKKGGRTIAQTPAPASDRVSGSKTNPKGSASDSELGKSIKFNDALTKAIQNKVDEYNDKHTTDKVSLATAKVVVRRGMGAYSTSHRPTISGGAPNSRQAWGLARLNKFLLKKSGGKVKSAYIQDDDLL